MKVQKSKVDKILLTGAKGLDPISLFIEDFEPGRGQITINCYNKSWTSYWGGCGKDGVLSFFLSCDKYYLTKNFMSHEERSEPDIAKTIKLVKKMFLETRRERSITKEEARDFWDFNIEELECCETIESIGVWVNDIYEVGENRVHVFEDWYFSIPEKPTSNCFWLREQIIPALQDVLKPKQTKGDNNAI